MTTLTDLHRTYQRDHDALHVAYALHCAPRCQLADHLVLQQALSAVRIHESAVRRNGDGKENDHGPHH